MLTIPEIVKYCDSSYSRGDKKCDDCTNDNCEGFCTRCFNSIHQVGEERDYDCHNLMHHYVCTYIYAYSSEIWHLFNTDNDLKSLDEYRVLSIGCGPASELFGIKRIANGKYIDYRGFDINERWTDIHEKVSELATDAPNSKVVLKIGNAFEEFDELDFMPNVIVLSYLISHLPKSNTEVDDFMSDLKTSMLDKLEKPYYIILNDINLNTARDKFPIIERKLEANDGNELSVSRYSFDGYNYGIRHGSRRLIENIPDRIRLEYDTWQRCKKTAQMLIKVY